MARLTTVCAGLVAGLLVVASVGPERADTLARADTTASTTPITFTGRPFGLPNALSTEDTARLVQGIAAAERGDSASLRALAGSGANPLVRRYLEWRWLTDEDSALGFSDVQSGLQRFEGWPRMTTLRRRGEQLIWTSGLGPAARIEWLRQGGGPLEGSGRAALAVALAQAGQRAEAVPIARAAWRADAMIPAAREALRAGFATDLQPADHFARADMLYWLGQRADAAALTRLMTDEQRAVMNARLAVRAGARNQMELVAALPSAAQMDPGILHERARLARSRGDNATAIAYARRIEGDGVHLRGREAIWDLKRPLIGAALRMRDFESAYRMARTHGLASGERFADAQWMTGWLALRFLNRPADAVGYFRTLEAGVGSPVSKARANYWLGLALEASGDREASRTALAAAAAFPTAFYGQLAAQKINPGAPLALPPSVEPAADERAAFERRELVQVLRMLGGIGNDDAYEGIAFFMDDQLDSAVELRLLSDLSRQAGEPRAALRSAKAGMFRGVISIEAAYPLMTLPDSVARGIRSPEPALVLAITRQESEFNPRAVSRANAVGLMQLLPSTAAMQARREGLPFSRAALIDDPAFNVTLGAAHLMDLVNEWDGSYILAIASYNAGSSRPREWIQTWGDPRRPGVDPIDWIELIPFSETRNYVQRVMENLIVYRARLAAEQPPTLRIAEDLRRGGVPG